MNSVAPKYGYFSGFGYKAFQKAGFGYPSFTWISKCPFHSILIITGPYYFKSTFPLEIWKMIYCFNVHFLSISNIWHFSMCLLAFPFLLWWFGYSWLCPFYYCAFTFFLLNCKRSYIENTEDQVNSPSYCFWL